jgi:hypothetical protein
MPAFAIVEDFRTQQLQGMPSEGYFCFDDFKQNDLLVTQNILVGPLYHQHCTMLTSQVQRSDPCVVGWMSVGRRRSRHQGVRYTHRSVLPQRASHCGDVARVGEGFHTKSLARLGSHHPRQRVVRRRSLCHGTEARLARTRLRFRRRLVRLSGSRADRPRAMAFEASSPP